MGAQEESSLPGKHLLISVWAEDVVCAALRSAVGRQEGHARANLEPHKHPGALMHDGCLTKAPMHYPSCQTGMRAPPCARVRMIRYEQARSKARLQVLGFMERF